MFSRVFQSFGQQPSISRSNSPTGRSKPYRSSPIPELDLEQLWNQRHHTCNYFKVFESAISSANPNLMKDKIQRRFAHARRHHNHEENVPVAVVAWAFAVVTSLWQGPSKSRLSSGPLDHPESEIASEWVHNTFRRKSRMHLSTTTMISFLGPNFEHEATEFRLRISFHNFEPKVCATVL